MNIEPTPSDREVLAGLVERVTYQNAENGFCVMRVKARGHRDLVTLVGYGRPMVTSQQKITLGECAHQASATCWTIVPITSAATG
jgi:exodeoxyribonuclease V alpha subunit